MNILEKIAADRQCQVDRELTHIAPSEIRRRADDRSIPLDFINALKQKKLSIVAEVKKASPSKGVIREDFQPAAIAHSYAQHGASCISVLTESTYFLGENRFLRHIRRTVEIPLLRKDFIVDERQIRESYELGADAILLIVALLSGKKLRHFQSLAHGFGLACLVEVHTERELEIALESDCRLIGINNRDLTTFVTDLRHSIHLRRHIPDHIVCVSESGIRTGEDCRMLHDSGFDAVLVGETLMRQPDPGRALSDLLREQ